MSRFAAATATVLALVLCGCATQDDVRRACADHDGVNAVSGNGVRKYVACRDGFYRAVR